MKTNILNKVGMLSEEDAKQTLIHTCNYFTFNTCLDLSKPIQVVPLGNSTEFTANQYSRDLASFIAWHNHFVMKDLNGFSGFSNVKFELMFTIKNQ